MKEPLVSEEFHEAPEVSAPTLDAHQVNELTRPTMVAATVVAPGRIELRELRLPEPGPNQARVRLEGCGICASNLPPWEGRPWFQYPMEPGALGHEGWGTIDCVGENVTEFRPGDRVAMLSSHAYAQYDIASTDSLLRLPDGVADSVFPGEPLGCAMNIHRRSQITKGDTVAIVGIGFLGALLTRLATAAGARVVAISRRAYSLEMATRMGAWRTVMMEDKNSVLEEVKSETGGELCRVVIEATGKQAPLDLAAKLTQERGRLVVAGYHPDGPRQVNLQLWNWRGLDVINAHERHPTVYLQGMEMAMQAINQGTLDPAPLYTHWFSLPQLADALNMTANRPHGFMKALIRF